MDRRPARLVHRPSLESLDMRPRNFVTHHLDSTFVPSFLVLVLRRNGAPPNVYLDPSSELARVQRGVLQRLAAECSGLSSLKSCPRLGAAARAQRSLEGT